MRKYFLWLRRSDNLVDMYEIIVKGKVQGVFYRDYTKKKADSLGLKGTVQNLQDGSVKIIVQDSPEVEKLINWCYEGSPQADVTSVESRKFSSDKVFDNFRIII
ncbi:MAG: acylphosphatase [Nanobdellota archaeon]